MQKTKQFILQYVSVNGNTYANRVTKPTNILKLKTFSGSCDDPQRRATPSSINHYKVVYWAEAGWERREWRRDKERIKEDRGPTGRRRERKMRATCREPEEKTITGSRLFEFTCSNLPTLHYQGDTAWCCSLDGWWNQLLYHCWVTACGCQTHQIRTHFSVRLADRVSRKSTPIQRW